MAPPCFIQKFRYLCTRYYKKMKNLTEIYIEKSQRTGRYADTAENRRLHRVGQPYKKRESKKDEDDEQPDENGNFTSITERVNAERAIEAKAKIDPVFKEKVVDELAKRVHDMDKPTIAKYLGLNMGALRIAQLSTLGEEAGVKISEKTKRITEQRERAYDERMARLKAERENRKKFKKLSVKEWETTGEYTMNEGKDSLTYEMMNDPEHKEWQRNYFDGYNVKIKWDDTNQRVVYIGKPKDLAQMMNDDEGYEEWEQDEPGFMKRSNFLDEEGFQRASEKPDGNWRRGNVIVS